MLAKKSKVTGVQCCFKALLLICTLLLQSFDYTMDCR